MKNALDRAVDWLFDALPAWRVLGLAAVLLGVSNLLDADTGMGGILTRDYGIGPVANTAAMLILIASGVWLLICRQRPDVLLYLPMVAYMVMTPVIIFVGAVIQYSPTTFWYGLKTVGALSLVGGYLLLRAIRQGDA